MFETIQMSRLLSIAVLFLLIGKVPASDLLIIAFGESNSGGQVDNADATAGELAARTLQIWNVNTEVFEALDVGTNNNLDHFGLDSTKHSWEIGLANIYDTGFFGRTVRYLQTGQGGSRVTEWESADAYWLEFVDRTTKAMAAVSGQTPVVWWTLGINDLGNGVTAATWKPLAQELIGRIY